MVPADGYGTFRVVDGARWMQDELIVLGEIGSGHASRDRG